jgi:peptide-methionine (R)-S-oxide reductase
MGGKNDQVMKSDDEWRRTLSAEQFEILRKHGTEPPGTSALNWEKRHGLFRCAGCGQPLFSSDTKYESGSGWPSFRAPLEDAVGTSADHTLAVPRVEVHCARCGGHLGHVFTDGPAPTGHRFCMNGAVLDFVPDEEHQE